MREIKFRAFDKEAKQMSYTRNINMDYDGAMRDFASLEDADLCGKSELMQYTGLKDKNGKEIYEGDIVKDIEDDITYIEFDNSLGRYCYHDDMYEGGCGDELCEWVHQQEVIGNIYENKELLDKPE